MKPHHPTPRRFVLPLPSFVMRPLTAVIIAAVHVYLAAGHLGQLILGDVQWTHIWKGFGAAAGAYVFAAIASRKLARSRHPNTKCSPDEQLQPQAPEPESINTGTTTFTRVR